MYLPVINGAVEGTVLIGVLQLLGAYNGIFILCIYIYVGQVWFT